MNKRVNIFLKRRPMKGRRYASKYFAFPGTAGYEACVPRPVSLKGYWLLPASSWNCPVKCEYMHSACVILLPQGLRRGLPPSCFCHQQLQSQQQRRVNGSMNQSEALFLHAPGSPSHKSRGHSRLLAWSSDQSGKGVLFLLKNINAMEQ